MKDIRDEDLKQLMSQLDTDGDGVVSYKEFVDQAFTISMFLSEKQLKAAFDLFDMNEDGMIGNCELQQVLTGGIKQIPEEEWDSLIEKFDTNGDGQIDYEEFKFLMIHLYVKFAQLRDDQLKHLVKS